MTNYGRAVWCEHLGQSVIIKEHAAWRVIDRWNFSGSMEEAYNYLASQIVGANTTLDSPPHTALLVADFGVIVIATDSWSAVTVYGWHGHRPKRPRESMRHRPQRPRHRGHSPNADVLRRRDARKLAVDD